MSFPLNCVTSGQGVQGAWVYGALPNRKKFTDPGEDFKGKGEGEEECTILDSVYFVHRRYIVGKKGREFGASRRLNRIKDEEREKERVCTFFLNSNYTSIINGIKYDRDSLRYNI